MMTPIEKIQLSYNCDEDYSKMTPCSLGKHCANCDKTVIDFRKSNISELTKALEEHGSVCGLFTKEQMSKKTTHSFNFLRRIAASFLFGISVGVYNNELKAQINICEPLTSKQDTTNTTDLFVGMIAETMPVYRNGGEKGLIEFFKKNLNYPNDSVQGRVYVSFTVDTTGKVIDENILRGLSEQANDEVLRVVRLLEFIPGTQSGKKVQVKYTLPISFHRDNEKKKK